MSRVVVLGAGPAGLAGALELAERGVEVTVLEKQGVVGGNAGSFNLSGVRVDYGSHRLHPAADPQVLARLKGLLGKDLIERPRHGRIRLLGRWIHFPLRPLDLLLRMHPRFAVGVGLDMLGKLATRTNASEGETFASILQQGLGRTICQEFYFPYARKIWGLDPVEISPIQAHKRVSAGSIGKMLRRLLPGGTNRGAGSTKGVFFYPRHGFGQISEVLHSAAKEAGASIVLNADVQQVALNGDKQKVVFETAGEVRTLASEQVFSTIPVTVLARLISPDAPEAVMQAANTLEFRAMLLVYLVLNQDRFTEFDAHYFPGSDYPFTRISEPKNYAATGVPADRTILCVEIPCNPDDAVWSMPDSALGELVKQGLASAGLPVRSTVEAVETRRISHAYPLYRTGYETYFMEIDRWLEGLDGVLTFGRQGLYAHDNTHHAIYMAQAAARCLHDDGSIDESEWQAERRVFETHVVED